MQTQPDPQETWAANPAAIPQPAPLPAQTEVTPLVIEDLKARRAFGIAKYGTPLMVENGRDSLIDLYQELLDAVVYLRVEIERRKRGITSA